MKSLLLGLTSSIHVTRRYGSVHFGVVLWINGEWGGIVRNDIFPDTLPYKYPYFSLFV